ncbi:MAG TPA: choice-of-anchor tandem repeat GloVer-containing protein [Bryobacteraceae bacterium]|nr:choice-of-anchor tandem repeat GloVer-containing protein [Bryobacteraceae bacterium]
MNRVVSASGKFNCGKRAYAVFALCATMAIALPGQTFTTLHVFDGADGELPVGALVQASDGNFYGATESGGANGAGTVFKITPVGKLTTLHSFCAQFVSEDVCSDGKVPEAGLVQAANGDLYGTTSFGGAANTGCPATGCGTIFEITPTGTLMTLYSFCAQTFNAGGPCPDGAYPEAALVQAADGDLYGTTSGGGAFDYGTVFKITPNGTLTTLYSFCAQFVGGGCPDANPDGGLVQGADGNFYGTVGGAEGGTVFKITPTGTLTTLYTFCFYCTHGIQPALIQGADGDLYGTTYGAGANLSPPFGTVFKITTSGTLTTLYSFCAQFDINLFCPDGMSPEGALVQGTDGNFYGTTTLGGATGGGTIFKITPGGTLTTLYGFCSQPACADGALPQAGLAQATNGDFYGTTNGGGAAAGYGTVFSLSVGLGPAVPAVNAGGVLNSASYTTQGVAPGSIVSIFGTNLAASTASANAIPLPTTLSDVTSVTFNSIPAGLYFVSQNQINAQLPFNVLPPGQDSGTMNVMVTRSNGTSTPQSVTVAPASPGIFTTTANGLGQAFAYDNTTGDLAAPAGAAIGIFNTAPISVGSGHALIIACTGLGPVTPSIGNYVAASDGILRNTLLQPIVLIGGVQAQFVYSVLSPQFVSEYQIGVIPGPATPTGDAVPIQIQIGGVTTTAQVTIAVAP